jgi:hypothetical protein
MATMLFEKKINRKIPSELIDYIHKDNQLNGWSNMPKSVELNAFSR